MSELGALVRPVSASFARALSAVVPDPPIDVGLARTQHAAYVSALSRAGARIETLPALDESPDAVFVEDTAVVVGGVAIVTRPGAPSRRDETESVAEALARDHDVARMHAPAALDGGDCMRVGDTLYVGRSARTNADGVAFLRRLPVRVVPVDLPDHVLHLKCVCSPLGGDRVLLAEGSLDGAVFGGKELVFVPRSEAYAANAVAVGRTVLVAAGYPRTAERLDRLGFDVVPIESSEARKADGSLTCQSILTGSDR
ncbi:MAG: N(G),N(G)-dimethylarginine dimethylaminohydrolase [Polyangiaceae bacterium]